MRAVHAAAALALLASAWPAGASSDTAGFAVSAWPARLVVSAPGAASIGVGNPGDETVRLRVQAESYALDARGRPRIGAPEKQWLDAQPKLLVIPPHGTARVHVAVRRPVAARSGDHAELVLLTTLPPPGRRVSAQLRLGVVVVARVPGRLVHRLAIAGIRRRNGANTRLEVTIRNRGNVDEWLGRGRVSVALVQHGWRLASAPIEPRRLLARSSGVVEARFRRRLLGRIVAVVSVRRPSAGSAVAIRRFAVRF